MGMDFDPAWEYFVPDPEVQEVFDQEHGGEGFNTIIDYRVENSGYRLGQVKHWDRSPRNCLKCGKEFKPYRDFHRYCSPRCRPSMALCPYKPPPGLSEINKESLKEMYLSGVRVWKICIILGIAETTFVVWRRKLGLTPRRGANRQPR